MATDNGPALHDELLALERRVGRLRERARLAGLRELDEALKVPHGGLGDCVAHVAPTHSTEKDDPS